MTHLITFIGVILLFAPLCVEGSGAQDPVKVDPKHFKVLFETAEVRLLEVCVAAGEKVPSHSHPAGFAYALSNFKARTTLSDGTIVDGEYKVGQFAETKSVTHAEENTGKTEAHLLLIEFKNKG